MRPTSDNGLPFQADHLAAPAASQRKLANDVHYRSVFLLPGGVAEHPSASRIAYLGMKQVWESPAARQVQDVARALGLKLVNASEDDYEEITCHACASVHFVNGKGKVLGGDGEFASGLP